MLRRHSERAGFTLIELLIVVVIIGILAAIAIPKFNNTKGKAYYAGMKSDLRNLMTAEESYNYDHQVYTTVLDSLNMNLSAGDSLTITAAAASGWSAWVTNPAAAPHMCAVFVGTATPLAPATEEGQIACQ